MDDTKVSTELNGVSSRPNPPSLSSERFQNPDDFDEENEE